MPKQVTFTGERQGEAVTARELVDALQSALVWLKGRDPDEKVDWEIVRIRLGNPISLTFSNAAANGEITRRMSNLHSLQNKRLPKAMPRLTDEDIDGTMALATVIGNGFKSMKISSADSPTVKLTSNLVERVEQIAKTTKRFYFEWTTIRGTLDQVTVAANSPPKFRLRHQLTGAEIGCIFDRDILAEVKSLLPHRVEVYGRVKFNRADRPLTIEAQQVRELPDRVSPFDSRPAVDITSGVDAFEYVEGLRGDE